MELSTVIFIGLLVCVVKDVHAGAKREPLTRRVSRMENDMNAWKGSVVDIEENMFDKFEGLESSLKEELTGTFVPSLIKRLLKQSIADILDEDYIGNIISARVIDQLDSMKVNIQNTKTRLKAITQQLRRVERERNTYRDVLKELTVTRRDIRALEQDVQQLNTSCVMRTETVPGSTTAPTDPSLSTTVQPVTVTSQDPDQHASSDPSQDRTPSTTVQPVAVTTQDPDQHATPSAAAGRDLWRASSRGDLGTVRRIVAAGNVDVNYRRGGSRTPVMMAAEWGRRDVVEFLVGEGADLSLVDKQSHNVLHYACVGGDLETVKLILALDVVDVNARSNDGLTAADIAREWGHQRVLDLLVSRGAH